ncbi:hypothetical protein [Aromatoleum petrolei]|uniref:Transmembrane protein n=1 Tax=Aromatoleum petrolei TaxID=76116 RepID=A0ABX1MH90_9RHOO|nr:hypothetical protein [Aromatoleum petrolei]NMF87153.1 hypothetical protein [Aromatoleum petrolei]QTQ34890.1 Uncharacterized protein ToN1_07150 [Aromatoleum petrolei]
MNSPDSRVAARAAASAQAAIAANDSFKYWRFCLACGPIFLLAYFGFWGLLGYCVPPLPAMMTAQEMAAHFQANAAQMRLGMVGAMTFAPTYMIWGLGITKVMETFEGNNKILSTLQLWGAGLTVIPVLMCCVFILAGSYRADTIDPSIVQLMYDMSWLTISVCYSVTTMQMIAMGVIFLGDKRMKPLVPKWLCWYSIWGGFMFIGEDLMPFFKEGVFARNGLVNFWIEYSIYFFYMIFVTGYLFKAVTRLETEARAGIPPLEAAQGRTGLLSHA